MKATDAAGQGLSGGLKTGQSLWFAQKLREEDLPLYKSTHWICTDCSNLGGVTLNAAGLENRATEVITIISEFT